MTKIRRLLLPNEMQPVSHYCHVTSAGSHVWVTGKVGVRSDGSIPNDVTEQVEIAINAVDRCLKAGWGRSASRSQGNGYAYRHQGSNRY